MDAVLAEEVSEYLVEFLVHNIILHTLGTAFRDT
jgi:hypothetical protein